MILFTALLVAGGAAADPPLAPRSEDFQINTYVTDRQSQPAIAGIDDPTTSTPAVAAADDGGFVVAWRSPGYLVGTSSILARRFDAAGIGSGTFQVHPGTTRDAKRPAIAGASDGTFAVVWDDLPGGAVSDGREVRLRLPVGGEIGVGTTGDDHEPALAIRPAGRLLVEAQGRSRVPNLLARGCGGH